MNTMDILVTILSIFGVTLFTATIIAYTLSHYSEIKFFASDVFRFFGFFGKWFRKVSVASELEGTLNGVIDDFNKSFSNPVLPNCRIQWVTPENQSSILRDGEAIVCLSFDRKDHDLNFFNATYRFVQTGLIAKTKPFFKKATVGAIDLLSTKIILKQYRRDVLRTFNQRFTEVEEETKNAFYKLEETDLNGLYSNLLIPELHHLGEILNEKTPSQPIESELENFISWFYDLATRDLDEKAILRFESPNVKVGVILVAKLSTYNQRGIEAYTKWAEKYASEHYNAVYLLSKGSYRNSIAQEVATSLIESKGFEQVNKNTILQSTNEAGDKVLMTCICLRPDPTTIAFNAWELLKKKHASEETVVGIVEMVLQDHLIVNVSGLKFKLLSKNLSSIQIPDATKIFKIDQELELTILKCEPSKQLLDLSNEGTQTDPKLLIDSNLQHAAPIKGIVTAIQRDKDGLEKGVRIKTNDGRIQAFIPRSKLTFSRFMNVSKKFLLGQEIAIVLEEFSLEYGNYIGHLFDLRDPWKSNEFGKLKNGDEVDLVVKEIQERFLSCELIEGLECRLFINEISWIDSECSTDKFTIDQQLKAIITSIDSDRRRISVSVKRFNPSPVKILFDTTKEKVFEGRVTSIDQKGLMFINEQLELEGFVHWSELIWGKISSVSECFSVGQSISVIALEYVDDFNSIRFSCKRSRTHQFDELIDSELQIVTGTILNAYGQICCIEINTGSLIAQAYIHKSKISNCAFLTNDDIAWYLPKDKAFEFTIERTDMNYKIIELSRKEFLLDRPLPDLGVSYRARITKKYKGKTFIYSNDLEGYIIGENLANLGSVIEVIPVNTSSNEFVIA